MKKYSKLVFFIVLFLVVLLAGVLFYFSPNVNEVTISGIVTDNDTSCFYDGICKMKINEFWTITDLGGDPSPEMIKKRGPHGSIVLANGTITGNAGENIIGKKVEVFAKIIDDSTLSLYGSSKYYIHFKN